MLNNRGWRSQRSWIDIMRLKGTGPGSMPTAETVTVGGGGSRGTSRSSAGLALGLPRKRNLKLVALALALPWTGQFKTRQAAGPIGAGRSPMAAPGGRKMPLGRWLALEMLRRASWRDGQKAASEKVAAGSILHPA